MNIHNLTATLSAQLQNLPHGTLLHTPDRRRARQFSILGYRADALYVQTQGGSEIRIPLQAFVRTLAHMHASEIVAPRPSVVGSSNQEPVLGGLCAISRGVNGETRWITYVLPVLQHLGWVHIDGEQRPNIAWMATTY